MRRGRRLVSIHEARARSVAHSARVAYSLRTDRGFPTERLLSARRLRVAARTACDLTNLKSVQLEVCFLHIIEHVVDVVAHVGDRVPVLSEGGASAAILSASLMQPRPENDINVAEVARRPVRARSGSVVTRSPFGATSDAEAGRFNAMEHRVDL